MQISGAPGPGVPDPFKSGPVAPVGPAAADAAIDAQAAADAAARKPAPKGRTVLPEGPHLPEGSKVVDGRVVHCVPETERDAFRLVRHRDQLPTENLPVPKDLKGIEFRRVEAPLFAAGVTGDDVIQNTVGDCYFLASLSAVAHTHPEMIRDIVKDNGDGTYNVTFRDPDTGEKLKPITVDAELPFVKDAATGKFELATAAVDRPGGKWNELWVAIVEKAYATLRGGYRRIDSGGNADEGFPVLTGKPAKLVYIESYVKRDAEDNLWRKLVEASEKKWPTATSTPVGDVEEERDDRTGIIKGHVYTVLGAYVRDDGRKMIRLRNPHGSGEPKGDGVDDGTFEISYKKYLENFEDLTINKLDPE